MIYDLTVTEGNEKYEIICYVEPPWINLTEAYIQSSMANHMAGGICIVVYLYFNDYNMNINAKSDNMQR